MKKISFLIGGLLVAATTLHAQQRITAYNARPAIYVKMPLQGDSINFTGEKYTVSNLLKTDIKLDFTPSNSQRLVADTAGYVTMAKADGDNVFYLLSTRLRAERFMKGTLNILSPARLEVFINGESKQVKESCEDSLSQAQPVSINLRMEPEANYEVVIKLLSTPDDKMEPILKCEFVKDKEYAEMFANFKGKKAIFFQR